MTPTPPRSVCKCSHGRWHTKHTSHLCPDHKCSFTPSPHSEPAPEKPIGDEGISDNTNRENGKPIGNRECVWCGGTLEEHRDMPYAPGEAIPRMPCIGLRSGFSPEKKEKECEHGRPQKFCSATHPQPLDRELEPRKNHFMCYSVNDIVNAKAEVTEAFKRAAVKAIEDYFEGYLHPEFCAKTGDQFKKCAKCHAEIVLNIIKALPTDTTKEL